MQPAISPTDNKQELLDTIFESQYTTRAFIPGPYGKRLLTYADYIASGQPLQFIEDFLTRHVFPFYANTHTESSFTGLHTSHLREEARQIIRQCVNATEDDVVLFCGTGSTAAVDKMNRLLEQRSKKTGEKFIIFHGPFEHHSNVLPWREGNFEVVPIAINAQGLVCLNDLETKLQAYQGKGTLIGSFSAASNVTGILSPVEDITQILHRYGALSFWDYAAGAPYMPIDMNPESGYSKDAIFISTHKFVGGPGTPGLLIAKRSLFTNDVPLVPGGGTVHFVTRNKQRYFEDIEVREEAGTPGIIESIRAGLAFQVKQQVGTDTITRKEEEAVTYALGEWKKNPNIFILGNTECARLAFFAFHIRCSGRFLHHNFVVALLNDLFGIQSRGGCSCAGPYGHELLDLSNEASDEYMLELATGNVGIKPGWVRLNLNYFIPGYEVEYIVKAVDWIATHGYKLLKEYHFDDKTALWKHKKLEHLPVHSLRTFSMHEPPVSMPEADRKTEQLRYLQEANEIAQEAQQRWASLPCQTYHYNQVENPLRWYTLAQDIS